MKLQFNTDEVSIKVDVSVLICSMILLPLVQVLLRLFG